MGEYVSHSPLASDELDVAKYRRRSNTAEADPLGNGSTELSDTIGSWNFQGLTDATTGSNRIQAEFSGQSSCYLQLDCVETEKNAAVEYQANYSPHDTSSGDSGGTFLDSDGYLIGTLYGGWNSDNYGEVSAGPTANELLDRLNAVLYDPSSIST